MALQRLFIKQDQTLNFFRINAHLDTISLMTDLFATLSASDKRRNLLIFLRTGPKDWGAIKEQLDVTSAGMIPQIKILEDARLITRTGSVYSLTTMGYSLAIHLEKLTKTAQLFDKDPVFWDEHNLDVIPDDLIRDIADLGEYQLLTVPDADLFDINPFLDNLKSSKTVTGISHHCHPSFPRFFTALAEHGVKSSLVLTPAVYSIIRQRYPEFLEIYLPLPNAELYVLKRDLKLSCAISDSYFSMSLFFRTGAFDTTRDVVSRDSSAIRWGERLVEYYRQQSVRIDAIGQDLPQT